MKRSNIEIPDEPLVEFWWYQHNPQLKRLVVGKNVKSNLSDLQFRLINSNGKSWPHFAKSLDEFETLEININKLRNEEGLLFNGEIQKIEVSNNMVTSSFEFLQDHFEFNGNSIL